MCFTNVLLFAEAFGMAKFGVHFFHQDSVGSACDQVLRSEYITQ